MLINTHVHMSRFGVDFAPELGQYFADMFAGTNCWFTGEPWKPEDFCVTPEQLVSDMDDAGIDKVCVLGIAYEFGGSYDPNAADYVGQMVADHPDRLIGFYTADPLGGQAEVRRFESAYHDHGIRGLKMLPSYNYTSLHDRRIWPLYEAAQGLDVPVILHTGWSSMQKGKMLEYDHPLYTEDIVIDFPDLKLVLAHVGFMWAEEVMHMMVKFPNVYADLAFLPETAPLWRMAQMFTWAKKLGVLGRFLWGSDYPYTDFRSGHDFLTGIPAYAQRHELEPSIEQADMDSVFAGAAQRLFELPGAPDDPGVAAAHC